MATSIPYDPALALGQILDFQRLDNLKLLAEANKPTELANAKLNKLTAQSYKMDMILQEMIGLGVPENQLSRIRRKQEQLKRELAKAATELCKATIKTEEEKINILLSSNNTGMSMSVESPLDYDSSTVRNFPLSYDSVKFDVQYVRCETTSSSSSTHAKTVSETVGKSLGILMFKVSNDTTESISTSIQKDHSMHELEGTIVICAHVTHRKADVIEPFVLDPKKAVIAWNSKFPDDGIQCDPQNMLKYSLEEDEGDGGESNCLHLLSGCTKSSSFVGYISLRKQETTTSLERAESTARATMRTMELDLFVASMSSWNGRNSSVGESAKKLLSQSQIQNSVGVYCTGIIPSIVADDISTTLYRLKPGADDIMQSLKAITESSNQATNAGMETLGREAVSTGNVGGGLTGLAMGAMSKVMGGFSSAEGKKGQQFMNLEGGFIKDVVTGLEDLQTEKNSVYNADSLFTCLTDFIDKAISGRSGVPTNFFIKTLSKSFIAKTYISRFYPYGVSNTKLALQGQLGQTPTKPPTES